MSGTRQGGLKARDANLTKDPDFYRKIGAKGGKAGHTGGFAANRELARKAGHKGGTISKRRPATESQRPRFATDAMRPKPQTPDRNLMQRIPRTEAAGE